LDITRDVMRATRAGVTPADIRAAIDAKYGRAHATPTPRPPAP
jgi:hypothetical protein